MVNSQRKYSLKSNSPKKSKKLRNIIIAIIAVVVVIFILEITNTTHFFHKQKNPAVIPVTNTTQPTNTKSDKSTNASTTQGTVNSTNTSTSTKQTSSGSSTPSGSSQPLVAPYGSFVSNHVPGQDGSTTAESSVCTTTPGASCYIQFTNTSSGAVTKLPSQVTDGSGSTSWSWNANILSSGSWQISAIATLNNKSITSTDSVKLEVQ